jgi:hypothetical protein
MSVSCVVCRVCRVCRVAYSLRYDVGVVVLYAVVVRCGDDDLFKDGARSATGNARGVKVAVTAVWLNKGGGDVSERTV